MVVAQPAGGNCRLDGCAAPERVLLALSAGPKSVVALLSSAEQIEQDLQRLQGKVKAVRTYTSGENLEIVPQRAGKYGLKVWPGAWLGLNEKENLEQINLLIDHANFNADTVERVIVGNEVLLRQDMTVASSAAISARSSSA